VPELPEVETVARQLEPLLSRRRISAVEILDAKLEGPDWDALKSRTIKSVYRSGKRIVIETLKGASPKFLTVHLRMTGRLIWVPSGGKAVAKDAYQLKVPLSDKSLRARFKLDGGELRFYDARRFGVLELHDSLAAIEPVGIEPLSERFSATTLGGLLAGARGEIKPWLLRQDKIAGIGNIYASEVLFACGIHPQRSAGSLSDAEVKAVWRETRRILRLAIKHCGTTFSDFQDSTGSTGSFQRFLKVYGCEGQPCPSCGGAIERLVQQQRSSFFCPNCQS
jgi:formamidopyrimidine-DNA glycosylase